MKWQGETWEMTKDRWIRGERYFALMPHQMHDGMWVWLDWYWSAWTPTHSGRGYWFNAVDRLGLEARYPRGPRPPKPQAYRKS